MYFSIKREKLLTGLQKVIGAVEKRQTLPILNAFHFSIKDNEMIISATDTEIEIKHKITNEFSTNEISFTLPGRKISEICKNLPLDCEIRFDIQSDKVIIKSEKILFTLATLNPEEFPEIHKDNKQDELTVDSICLKRAMRNVQFSMAQQDVRYYLNGMLFDMSGENFRTVTTDGHRLALSEFSLNKNLSRKVIIPRKAVIEIDKLLTDQNDEIKIEIFENYISMSNEDTRLSSKIIDGKFPDYYRVIPKGNPNIATVRVDTLKSVLHRALIISNEKFKAAKFRFAINSLIISTQNQEREELSEQIDIQYKGHELEIAFNINYILDIINTIDADLIALELGSSDASMVVNIEDDQTKSTYVVMPMRL